MLRLHLLPRAPQNVEIAVGEGTTAVLIAILVRTGAKEETRRTLLEVHQTRRLEEEELKDLMMVATEINDRKISAQTFARNTGKQRAGQKINHFSDSP